MSAGNTYLVFDFETSGLNPHTDRIIQVGTCLVEDNQVVQTDGWLVRQEVRFDPEAVARHRLSEVVVAEKGIDPAESLDKLLQQMTAAPTCIGHNIHRFDLRFLKAECKRLDRQVPRSDMYVDTAALYKGWQLKDRKAPQESHRSYAERVLSKRVKGLQYSIPACLRRFQIEYDNKRLHDAAHDAVATHLIYQALRKLI